MESRFNQHLSYRVFFSALTALYAACVAAGLCFHQPWRDEAQSWLLVRDVPLGLLFHRMRYEGTPGLWHLLVLPWARLGFPYEAQSLLHAALAVAAAGVFVWRSPFPRWQKTFFVFSYYMVYEYAVIARNYVLGILLLFLATDRYRTRFRQPLVYGGLVALLANTNYPCFWAAAALTALYVWDGVRQPGPRRDLVCGLGLMLLGLGLAGLQFRPPADYMYAGLMQQCHVHALRDAALDALMPLFAHPPLLSWIWCALLAATAATLVTRRAPAVFLAVCYAGLAYFFVFKNDGSPRHHGFVLVFLVAALWMDEIEPVPAHAPWLHRLRRWGRPVRNGAMAVWLPFSVLAAGVAYTHGVQLPFSGSCDMAQFIRVNGLQNRPVIACKAAPCSALLPYLPGVRFWYVGIRQEGTYLKWDTAHIQGKYLPTGDVVARVREQAAGRPGSLLLLSFHLPVALSSEWELLYQSPPAITKDEQFFLYQPRAVRRDS